MQTILELLNEIRWNPNLQIEDYEIGYYDRIDRKIIRLELGDMILDSSDKFAFILRNIRGKEVRIQDQTGVEAGRTRLETGTSIGYVWSTEWWVTAKFIYQIEKNEDTDTLNSCNRYICK